MVTRFQFSSHLSIEPHTIISENGYNIYDGQIYVSWLQQKHPDDLQKNLSSSINIEEQVNKEQTEPPNCNTSTEDGNTSDKEHTVPSPEQPTNSLSASLANTKVFVTELREILNERKVVTNKSISKTQKALVASELSGCLIKCWEVDKGMG